MHKITNFQQKLSSTNDVSIFYLFLFLNALTLAIRPLLGENFMHNCIRNGTDIESHYCAK